MIEMFPEPSRNGLGHPLTEGAIRQFTHPDPQNPLRLITRNSDGHLVASNGRVTIKVSRGLYMMDEFAYPAPEDHPIKNREAGPLPWNRFQEIDSDDENWRPLSTVTSLLFRFAQIPVFRRSSGPWINYPCAHVRFVEGPIFDLSVLQLVSRLPRVEVYTKSLNLNSHVLFRFTAGFGIMANEGIPGPPNFSIFRPVKNPRSNLNFNWGTPPEPEPVDPSWPPPEPID